MDTFPHCAPIVINIVPHFVNIEIRLNRAGAVKASLGGDVRSVGGFWRSERANVTLLSIESDARPEFPLMCIYSEQSGLTVALRTTPILRIPLMRDIAQILQPVIITDRVLVIDLALWPATMYE